MEIEPIYLFDKNKELIDIIPYEDLLANSQDWTLNGLIKGTVSGIYTESIEQAHFYGTRDIDDPNVFWQYKIVNYTKENGQFTFEGIYVLFDDLAGRGVIRDRRPKNAPITTVMEYILEDTGWQLGQVQSTHRGTSNYYYVTKLEAFWDFLSKWRVEFKPRMTFSNGKVTGKYIDIYDRLSDDFGKWYEYGDSLLTVVAEEMRENVFTAFIGRGRGEEVGDGFGRKIGFEDVIWTVEGGSPVDKPKGQDYVEVPWATDLYGYEDGAPRMAVVDFPDIEDAAELLNATYEYALTECRPKVQFKSNVLEIGRADIGEIVTILRPDMGIRYKTRVFNTKRDFLNKSIKTIQFGEQLVQSTAQRTKKTVTAIKKQEEQTVYWLEALRQAIVDSYFNEDGYNYDLDANNEYGLPGGYYSFDRPIDQSPTKVVYVGAGKVLIANSQNPDGSWIWRTAITGDGIVADEINTGVLKASLIQAGFNEIAYGVIMTQDGLYNVSSQGYYTHLGSGNLRFFSDDDELNGMLSLAYAGDRSGMAVFAEVGHGFSVIRRRTDGQPNKTIFQLPDDVDELRMSAPFNANGNTIKDAGVIEAHSFRIKNTNQYIANIVGGGGAYFDTQKVSLGIGGDSGISMKITALPDKVEITEKLDMKNKVIERVSNVKPFNPNSNKESFFFTGDDGYANIGGRNGTNIGHHNGSTLPTALKIPESGAIVSYRDLNMNGNTVTGTSDMRLKKNIRACEIDPLKEIEKMHFVTHEWDKENPVNENKPSGERFGQIAQYAPAILQVQNGEKDHYLSIDKLMQTDLNSFAIQRLKEENDTLKQELAELKNILHEKGLI
ncbi:phage tail spike protein [Jeotgalibaca porci]|uniref:phage tail spike protein n=1 Tax=Jeotgalibaca porci TaxID=1868793 RepID=UPI0035A04DA9